MSTAVTLLRTGTRGSGNPCLGRDAWARLSCKEKWVFRRESSGPGWAVAVTRSLAGHFAGSAIKLWFMLLAGLLCLSRARCSEPSRQGSSFSRGRNLRPKPSYSLPLLTAVWGPLPVWCPPPRPLVTAGRGGREALHLGVQELPGHTALPALVPRQKPGVEARLLLCLGPAL